MRERIEYLVAWFFLKTLESLPRPLARRVSAFVAKCLFILRPPLQRAAQFNLRLAFPELPESARRRIITRMVRNVGWMAVEFARMPRYTRGHIESVIILEGFEHFIAAERRGKGVLLLTGHMGAWELGPFAHAVFGSPINFLMRPIDNTMVNRIVNRYRCASGNRPIRKNESARVILRILKSGGVVGVLADQNTIATEAVFVDFFGTPASTTTGIARLARRTGAAVVPAYTYWDSKLAKYRLSYEPALELPSTGDEQSDIRDYCTRFNHVIEDYIRRFPDQWLWVHRRWKNRPPAEAAVYPDEQSECIKEAQND